MWDGFSMAEWTSRFAEALRAGGLDTSLSLCEDVAREAAPTLGSIRPEDAARAYLAVSLEEHEWVGSVARLAMEIATRRR